MHFQINMISGFQFYWVGKFYIARMHGAFFHYVCLKSVHTRRVFCISFHRATKSIAMSIAWSFNSVISAVSSSMVGSLFITRALIKIANDREMTFNGLIPKDDKNTQIDELASYVFAFMGVWFQFKIQFSLPVIMRLFLWPIEIAEWFIQWSVTGS